MTTFAVRSQIIVRPRYLAKNNRWVSRFFTLSAAIIVLIIHALWMLAAAGYNPENRGTKKNMSAPEVYFMSDVPLVASATDSINSRLFRSPVLMSLPTGIGFSGPMLKGAQLEQPPRFIEKPVEFLRSLPKPFEAGAYGESHRDLKVLAKTTRTVSVPGQDALPENFMVPAADATSRIVMYWPGRPDKVVEIFPDEQDLKWAGSQPWEATVFICFDSSGWVEDVLLEKPTPLKDANDRVLRMARGRSVDDAMAGECGRIVAKFIPAITSGEK